MRCSVLQCVTVCCSVVLPCVLWADRVVEKCCRVLLLCVVAVCVVGGSGGGDVLPCVVAVYCCSVCWGWIGW